MDAALQNNDKLHQNLRHSSTICLHKAKKANAVSVIFKHLSPLRNAITGKYAIDSAGITA
jgi:hypothetical protein